MQAVSGILHEIIVIDNNSPDGNPEDLQPLFQGVRFVRNTMNTGFARACNQGFALSSGSYVLFLNPDTLVGENCLHQCISFMENHQEAGAAGVRMVDGKGKFLKESKRGFPSLSASFFKLFGLSGMFPRSGAFGKYYLSRVPETKDQEVDILSGAFMMIRREVYRQTGGFDESFFMYGEDIDLSWRIKQLGYKNYYLGSMTITHLKGGSTSHDWQQLDAFYEAMHYFVKKHFSAKYPAPLLWLIHSGIGLRKFIAGAGLLFRKGHRKS